MRWLPSVVAAAAAASRRPPPAAAPLVAVPIPPAPAAAPAPAPATAARMIPPPPATAAAAPSVVRMSVALSVALVDRPLVAVARRVLRHGRRLLQRQRLRDGFDPAGQVCRQRRLRGGQEGLQRARECRAARLHQPQQRGRHLNHHIHTETTPYIGVRHVGRAVEGSTAK